MRECFIVDSIERGLTGAAGIVDDDIDAAEPAHRFFDEAFHVARFRCVSDDGQHLGAQLFAFGRLRLQHLAAPRADCKPGAELRNARRGRTADALAAAGDRDDFAFKTQVHFYYPFALRWSVPILA